MKYVLYLLIGLLVFAVTMVTALAVTGNLNAEALAALTGAEQEAMPATETPDSDTLGPLAQQLKAREAALNAREAKVKDMEMQLQQRQAALEKMRTELEGLQKQIGGAMEDADTERAARVQSVAITLEKMKPDKAAERLVSLPAEEVASILALVKDKARGKIIEAMDPDQATRVLQMLQESPI